VSGILGFLADVPGGFAALAPAALAGLVTEQCGFLNIALEGLVMAGAFAYIAVGSLFGPWAGLLAALAVPALLAGLADLLARRGGADSFVVGLGLNLLVPGLVPILSYSLFATKGIVAAAALQSARPFSALAVQLPLIGPLVFGGRATDYLVGLGLVVTILLLKHTDFGLRNRALGMNPDTLRMAGVNPHAVRRNAWLLSGALAGLSGLSLAASIGAWVPNISAGRGWIALVAVFLGGKRLGGTLLASLSFTVLLAAASRAQLFAALPAELLTALPYLLTAIVVMAGAAHKRRRNPVR